MSEILKRLDNNLFRSLLTAMLMVIYTISIMTMPADIWAYELRKSILIAMDLTFAVGFIWNAIAFFRENHQ